MMILFHQSRKLVPVGACAVNAIRSLTQVAFSLLRSAIEVAVDPIVEEISAEPIGIEVEGIRVEVDTEEVFAEPEAGGGSVVLIAW